LFIESNAIGIEIFINEAFNTFNKSEGQNFIEEYKNIKRPFLIVLRNAVIENVLFFWKAKDQHQIYYLELKSNQENVVTFLKDFITNALLKGDTGKAIV
jgi:serine kinase of HPr protein (carbohydrate metabolism regulator)